MPKTILSSRNGVKTKSNAVSRAQNVAATKAESGKGITDAKVIEQINNLKSKSAYR